MRLLVSARDPGAAFNLRHVALAATRRRSIEVCLVAGAPAHEIFQESGLEAELFDFPHVTDSGCEAAGRLIAEAGRLLGRKRPDAVLVGLSRSGEGGIDEALLQVARGIRRYAMQDFWGDVNSFFGQTAELYFVADEEAARLSQRLHGVECEVTGSPKHAAYATVDWSERRASLRSALGLQQGQTLFGYFGQALGDLPGYQQTVRVFAEVIATQFPQAVVALRAHPRESARQAAATREQFDVAGVRWVDAARGDTEVWLAGADVCCSVFSNVCYDVLHLNRFASGPLGSPVYLLFDERMQQYYRANSNLSYLPAVAQGYARLVADVDVLGSTLREAGTPRSRRALWRSVHRGLPDASSAVDRILDRIEADAHR